MAIYPQDQQNNSHDNDIDNDSLHCVFNFTAMRLQTFSDTPLKKIMFSKSKCGYCRCMAKPIGLTNSLQSTNRYICTPT